jgi:hypothetical protein
MKKMVQETEKLGIDEILKVIDVAKGNVFSLAAIDWDVFASQCRDLDKDEDIDVIIEVGKAVIEIIAMFGTGGLSVGLKLLAKTLFKL